MTTDSTPLPSPSAPSKSVNQKQRSFRIFRKIVIVLLVVVAVVIASMAAFYLWLFGPKPPPWLTNPFWLPKMAAIQYSPRDVLAELGGMPVKIPSYFANFVEHNGDPDWGEKRQGPIQPRT